MNKIIVIAGIVVLVLVGGGLFIADQNSEKPEQEKAANDLPAGRQVQKDPASGQETMENKDDAILDKNNSSRYIEYSKVTLGQASDNRRVLYCYASWCPTCKPADADFQQNANKIPENMVVIRVNYNDPETDQEEKDLAKKYGITYQHTFVQIDGQGNEVNKWNGGKIEELLANIK